MKKLMILFLCVMGVISGAEQVDKASKSPYTTGNGLDSDGWNSAQYGASICACANYDKLIEEMKEEAGTDSFIVDILHEDQYGRTAGDIAFRLHGATGDVRCKVMGHHYKKLEQKKLEELTFIELARHFIPKK